MTPLPQMYDRPRGTSPHKNLWVLNTEILRLLREVNDRLAALETRIANLESRL